MRIGILSSHPIQYQAPWFRELAKRATVEVFFAFQPTAQEQGAGFGTAFSWDVDLLSGYRHRFLTNRAVRPSADQFTGCNTPEIGNIIKAEDFDAFIVCGWNLKTYWQAVRACRRLSLPVLVRGDSQVGMQPSRMIRTAKALVYPVLRKQFDGFLSVGARNREYLRHYGAPSDRIFFAPHFVDNERFRERVGEARAERYRLREKWGVDAGGTVALFAGKFIPKKRTLDFLDGVGRARQKGGAILPVLVGSGEMEPTLRRLAQKQKIPAQFEGFRNQSELPAYYAAADVLVLPSDYRETWGLVVNEAMACGLPAIVSDAVGCAPDLIEEGVTGFTFPLGDRDALGEALLRVRALAPDQLKERLDAKLDVYSAATCARNTVAAIASIIESGGRGRLNAHPVR